MSTLVFDARNNDDPKSNIKVLSTLQVLACCNMERVIDPWAVKYVVPAMHGDSKAALSLGGALRNEHRGEVTRLFWKVKAPKNVVRALVSSTWEHDHQWLVAAIGAPSQLRKLFAYADFEIPPMADGSRVWRGTSGLSFERARKGYSWTLDRDVACWFAMRYQTQSRTPLVMFADIARSEIAYFPKDRSENEIVLLTPPLAIADPTPTNWIDGFKKHSSRIKESDSRIRHGL